MQPDDWARANRVYGAEKGIPGPREPSLAPYVIPWGRALASGTFDMAVLCCGAQMSKTDTMLDVIGERLDRGPAPIIYVGPTKEFCSDIMEPRVMELLDQSEALASRVARGKRMKKSRKMVNGVSVRLAHAGSATSLMSEPAALALVDEYDQMLKNIKGKGDPLGLVRARGFTYADFTVGVASTPTTGSLDVEEIEGLQFWKLAEPEDIESPIWSLWQEGTRHHWCWPCPECGEYFVPRFSLLKWERVKGEETTPARARRTAYVECPRCAARVENRQKAELNTRGKYAAPGQSIARDGEVRGPEPENSIVSFWVSGLCSPFTTFGEGAEAFVSATREADSSKIQTTVNSRFGELYVYRPGDAPEWQEVAEHRSEYSKGEIPDEAVHLVVTVDVQKNRLIWTARGWGPRATSWLADYGELWGETVNPEVWDDLSDLISQPMLGMQIKMVLIDSGFRPGRPEEMPLNRVYDFCRRHRRLVWATKGSSQPMRTPMTKKRIDVTVRGSASKYGLELLWLDPDHWKSWVHERVRWPKDRLGAWHLPQDVDEDYLKQIVSEWRVRLPSGRVQWVQKSRDNHYLDCEAMQAAAAHMLNASRIPVGAARTAAQEFAGPGDPGPPPATGAPAAPGTPPPRRPSIAELLAR